MTDQSKKQSRQQTSTDGNTKRADSDVFANVSVVIPSKGNKRPITLESVPDEIETCVVSQGNRSEARNIGAKKTSGDILVFLDDDIRFTEDWLRSQLQQVVLGRIIGLKDYGLGYLITRFMLMYRDTFNAVGGFDSKLNHMEDTEFCIRARKSGMSLDSLSQRAVTHVPHEKTVTTADRLKSLLYLTQKHPKQAIPVWRKVLK
ncbi:MAG: glycosyltransferase [Haloquadratum phage sp.]|nr:MAG: glycosyltransferase [Haloquadratum phage sp.]